MLCYDIDLHMNFDPILGQVIWSDTETCIQDQCIQPGELRCYLLSYFVGVMEIFQFDLDELDF